MADEDLWELTQQQGRLLITTDKGFVRYRDQPHHGILVVRLRQPNQQKIHERVVLALTQFDLWSGLLVVTRDTVQSIWRTS